MNDLIVNGCMALILSSLTGSIFFLAWMLTRKLFEKQGAVSELYRLLCVTVLAYLVPFLYVYFWIQEQRSGFTGARPFQFSPLTLRIARGLFAVWLCGAVLSVVYNTGCLITLRRLRRSCFDATRREKAVCHTVCREIGLSEKRFRLGRSYHLDSPAAAGGLTPYVILPVKEFTDQELRYVLLHELNHCRQGDPWLKSGMMLVRTLYWFNPLVWVLQIALERWCEYSCDYHSCRILGEMKEYFLFILTQVHEKGKNGSMYSRLIENRSELERRVKKMKKCLNCGNGMRGAASALFCLLILAGSATAFAAGKQVSARYREWEDRTEVAVCEEASLPPFIEHTELPVRDGVKEEVGPVETDRSGNSGSFTWTVSAGTRKTTAGKSVAKGKTISVFAAGSNAHLKVGVVHPDGVRTYAQGTNSVYYSYTTTKAGTYKIYVENTGTASVTVSGTYSIE